LPNGARATVGEGEGYSFKQRTRKENFLRMSPILLAGYLTGVGLIAMATIALRLIKAAIFSAPF
jgi:hypothetical protein